MRARLLVAALALSSGACAAGGAAATESEPAAPTATAAVERRDLVEEAAYDATLGYGPATAVSTSRTGTVTALPEEGAVVERGGVLAEIDTVGIRLLYGTVPAYRALDVSVSDGADVRQLEENLVALGYLDVADDDFASATRTAVAEWQEDLGVEETGRIEPGDIAFLPGPVRVAEHQAAVGTGTGATPLLTVTGTERIVNLDLPVGDRQLVDEGQAVGVELPDDQRVAGAVRHVGRVAEAPADDEGEATVEVEVTLDDPAAAGHLDVAPVTVLVEREAARGVLAVPVGALLALEGGRYAVERASGDLVDVELGAFADGWVEVLGDLAEGDAVVVPA